jgi:hypothetical protein
LKAPEAQATGKDALPMTKSKRTTSDQEAQPKPFTCTACQVEVLRSLRAEHILSKEHRIATLYLFGAPASEIAAVESEN